MTKPRPLEMQITLNALKHLGMNLYSNTPAVLSEIVANAWDADATEVKITIDKENSKITIQDNGIGMTRDEVIDCFLTVGYERRKGKPETTQAGRKPMGRKGIGKLSSFSVANKVDVYTIRNNEPTAFQMDAKKIDAATKGKGTASYEPKLILADEWPEDFKDLKKGTYIVLSEYKRKLRKDSIRNTRQQIARRFSVIGEKPDNFQVFFNGEEIGPQDRGYYQHVEYLWTYGDQKSILGNFVNLSKPHTDRTKDIDDIDIKGWIGTVKKPSLLDSKDGESSNRIAIFMRGKQAQADIMKDRSDARIYNSYLVGEIHCDSLDDDNDDIATSDRQSLKKDDPKFQEIVETIRNEIKDIGNAWTEMRTDAGAEKFAKDIPAVKEWLNSLDDDTQKKARSWIGRLNLINEESLNVKELVKSTILAFEHYRQKGQLYKLQELAKGDIEPILKVFTDIAQLEQSYYGEIVKFRLGVIETLEKKIENNALERELQTHLFKHLWLLDPSWERAHGTEKMEKLIERAFGDIKQKIDPNSEEAKGRIDIAYRKVTGAHVIVELKRPKVRIIAQEVSQQIEKYLDAAKRQLMSAGETDPQIEAIVVVGEQPSNWDNTAKRKQIVDTLKAVNGQLVFYNELLANARAAYQEYYDKAKKLSPLTKIWKSIDNFDKNATS